MLELSNFLTLFGGDTSAFTSALLDLIEDEQLGRNPYAMEYVQSQRKVLADPQLLFGLFPAWRDRLTRVRNIARLVDPVLSRVLTYSQATGAPLGLPEEWPPPALTDGAAIMAAVGLMEEESK